MDSLKERLGDIDVVFILDSTIPSYDAFGVSVSLRGNCKF